MKPNLGDPAIKFLLAVMNPKPVGKNVPLTLQVIDGMGYCSDGYSLHLTAVDGVDDGIYNLDMSPSREKPLRLENALFPAGVGKADKKSPNKWEHWPRNTRTLYTRPFRDLNITTAKAMAMREIFYLFNQDTGMKVGWATHPGKIGTSRIVAIGPLQLWKFMNGFTNPKHINDFTMTVIMAPAGTPFSVPVRLDAVGYTSIIMPATSNQTGPFDFAKEPLRDSAMDLLPVPA